MSSISAAVASSWRALVLRIGDKCTEYSAASDYEDHIELCFGAVRRELEHSKIEILDFLLQCAEQLPHKIPLYGTMVFRFNLFIVFCLVSCVCGNIDDDRSVMIYDRVEDVGFWKDFTRTDIIILLFIIFILFLPFFIFIRRECVRGGQERDRPGDIELQTVVTSPMEVNQFPLHTYGGDNDGYYDEKCSICLIDFERGEELRSYPRCTHAYHVQCIEGTIRAGIKTCPLCRSPIPVRRVFVQPEGGDT